MYQMYVNYFHISNTELGHHVICNKIFKKKYYWSKQTIWGREI